MIIVILLIFIAILGLRESTKLFDKSGDNWSAFLIWIYILLIVANLLLLGYYYINQYE